MHFLVTIEEMVWPQPPTVIWVWRILMMPLIAVLAGL
jgi:hypothetical protein